MRRKTVAVGRYHCHAYYFWEGGEGVSFRNTDPFVFETVRPSVDACTVTSPWNFKAAAEHGLWYVHVTKRGTVAVATNAVPWQDYM